MRETIEQVETTARGFPYPELDLLPDEVREKYESLPAKINLFRMLAHSSGLFVPLMDFTEAVFKKLDLSKPHYELIVLFTARSTDCEYEWKQHVNTAPKAGVKPEQIRAIESGRTEDAEIFDARERLLLKMADELLRNVEVSQATLNRAMQQLSSSQIVEVMIIVGFYRALAGLIRSVSLDYNPEAAAALAKGM